MTALVGADSAQDLRPWRRTAPVRFSVVICCHTDRRWNDIIAAVESVRAQSLPPAEVLVVVDDCEDLLDRLWSRWADVSVLANAHRRGLSGARNTGTERSTGDVVAFLDDDAVADRDWLVRIADEYADPQVAGVGGRADPGWASSAPRWFPDEFAWTVGASYRGLPPHRAVVRNVFGCNMSFRREVLLAIGGFRECLGRARGRPMGGEETELCIRATARTGGSIVYQPAAVVTHRVSAERERFAYFRVRCFAEGLSKALVAQESSSSQALRTERSYVSRVLPAGVLRGLGEGISGHPRGFARAGAIVVGLAVTAWGYGVGRAVHRLNAAPSSGRTTTVAPQGTNATSRGGGR